MGQALKRLVGFAVAAVAPVVMAGPAWTGEEGVQPDFKMDYYEVSGDTWSDIWNSIKANLQKQKNLDGKFEGVTFYSVRLGPKELVDNDTCSAQTATLAVNLVVKVPQLTTRKLKPPDQECWAFYDRSLSDHEEWHVTIAVHEANALLDKIRANPNASCRAIGQLVNQEFKNMKDEQDAYDAKTSHGVEQWRAYDLGAPKESAYSADVRNRCFG